MTAPSQKRFPSSRSSSLWDMIGSSLPPFFEASSTKYYSACERQLFRRFFSNLRGKKLLKTDLWDEAKNSRILQWASQQRAEVYGIDISPRILKEARSYFSAGPAAKRFIVSDVRNIAFAADSFDFLYSMGTVEHFPEYEQAVRECFRVLQRGGRAIIGVPNKGDPFLRPLLVGILNKLGLYAYGFEKSFSRRSLELMLKSTGFRIIETTGILFIPGWLRMADLFLYIRWPDSRYFMAPLIFPFFYLFNRFSSLRQHGYLLACVAEKP